MECTEADARLGSARGEALSALGVNYARVGRVRDAIRLFKQASFIPHDVFMKEF